MKTQMIAQAHLPATKKQATQAATLPPAPAGFSWISREDKQFLDGAKARHAAASAPPPPAIVAPPMTPAAPKLPSPPSFLAGSTGR